MYLCIAAAVIGLLADVVCVRKGRQKEWGLYALILVVSGILGILICVEDGSYDTKQRQDVIERPTPGSGDIEKTYVLSVEDLEIKEPYRVTIENRHLTKVELEELFEQAVQELEQAFLGENESFDRITQKVFLVTDVLDGRVEVNWRFDNYQTVNLEGELQQEALTEEGTMVQVTATLSYEDIQVEHQFSMMVYPSPKTETERFYERLERDLQIKNESTDEQFQLPEEVAGHALIWKKQKQKKPYTILLLGLCAMAGVAIGRKEDQRKAKAARDERLLAEYPQMLSQMELLLGAGMTVSNAWERIVVSYENRRASMKEPTPPMPVYEEMRVTYHQMKDGVGERKAYEAFGERIGLQAYRRLSTLLVQNLRKGTAGLCKLLEKEMRDAFEAQESYAKKKGEELQTKLLLPMMLMLGLVIVIIMIPAIAGFQV